jgi:hypothetical protein
MKQCATGTYTPREEYDRTRICQLVECESRRRAADEAWHDSFIAVADEITAAADSGLTVGKTQRWQFEGRSEGGRISASLIFSTYIFERLSSFKRCEYR